MVYKLGDWEEFARACSLIIDSHDLPLTGVESVHLTLSSSREAETICSVYTNEQRRRPAIEFKLLEQEFDRADN
ncbi:hypothetical protein BpHYR1_047274 [Brachionus plicatilis]|uniref:Uncharacterized protein n=1 Tax=Brachionus plicatilis TaxID=10195 RepID=A0A3M7SI64_BRAPC|nr:hypothetical protein BpHYR1_047274 [Brachionus plicatilis]